MKIKSNILTTIALLLLALAPLTRLQQAVLAEGSTVEPSVTLTFALVDTGQTNCYNLNGSVVEPASGDSLYGQDANYQGNQPKYRDNGDGTVTDLVTGLVWQQEFGEPLPWQDARQYAENLTLAGKSDWRLPTMKELLSIADFSGGMPFNEPYLNTDYFAFEYGGGAAGNRDIDAQYWSSNDYVGTVMNNQKAAFGFNFADGRIKGYPQTKSNYIRCVRGGDGYGENQFVDNGDGTISDLSTGLMWLQEDSGTTFTWSEALQWAEELQKAGYSDWRLPNAKELQSIVDYSRAPDAGNAAKRSAAIDPLFSITSQESYFWSSTSFGDANFRDALYVAFGQAMGQMNGTVMNVHGAGAMRGDPKTGNPDNYPNGRGPQGDDIRIYNYARAVRTIDGLTEAAGVDLENLKTTASRDQAEAGERLRVKARVRNSGTDAGSPVQVSYYLSRKAALRNNAILLGTSRLKGLKPDRQKWVSLKTTVPDGLRSGLWYLVTVVDEAATISELSRSNNTSAAELFIF